MKSRLSCSILNFVHSSLNEEDLADVSLEAMGLIKRAGFEQVELYIRKANSELIGVLNQGLKKYGLTAPTVHLQKSLLERGIEYASAKGGGLIEAAAKLGARQVVIHPPIKKGFTEGIAAAQSFLEQNLESARRQGMCISLETVPIEDSDRFINSIVSKFPPTDVKVTLDLKFLASIQVPLERLFETLSDRISNIHINDFAGFLEGTNGKRHYPFPGSGIIDFDKVAQILKVYNYNGLLTLETSLEGFNNRLNSLLRAKEILVRLGEVN